jgi:hypothetical protein
MFSVQVRLPVPLRTAICDRNVMDSVKATRHAKRMRRSIPAAYTPVSHVGCLLPQHGNMTRISLPNPLLRTSPGAPTFHWSMVGACRYCTLLALPPAGEYNIPTQPFLPARALPRRLLPPLSCHAAAWQHVDLHVQLQGWRVEMLACVGSDHVACSGRRLFPLPYLREWTHPAASKPCPRRHSSVFLH